MKTKDYLKISSNEVHVWAASLRGDKNELSYFSSLLSADEIERSKNFKNDEDKQRYICARGILRCILAKYLENAPQGIEFIYGLWGKPYLLTEKTIYFNISHSRDYALYAVTKDYEVGVDIEYIDKKLDVESIVPSMFSAIELDYWKALDPKYKINFFFKVWTCKEAYLKALGKGWLENKNETPTDKLDSINKRITHLMNDKITYPHVFECIPDFVSALYVDGPALKLVQFTWDSELMI